MLPLPSSLPWVVLLSPPFFRWWCRFPILFFEVKFKYRNKPNYIELNFGPSLELLASSSFSWCCLPLPSWVWCCFLLRLSPCGWCCLPSPPLAGAVVAPSFFGKVLLSPSPFGWHCSIPSSMEAAFLILFSCFPASFLGWCCSSASALDSSFGSVFSSVFSVFRVIILFVFHVLFNFQYFHFSFHVFHFVFIVLFHFHIIFSSYSNHCYDFHVSLHVISCPFSGNMRREWKHARRRYQNVALSGSCGFSFCSPLVLCVQERATLSKIRPPGHPPNSVFHWADCVSFMEVVVSPTLEFRSLW